MIARTYMITRDVSKVLEMFLAARAILKTSKKHHNYEMHSRSYDFPYLTQQLMAMLRH